MEIKLISSPVTRLDLLSDEKKGTEAIGVITTGELKGKQCAYFGHVWQESVERDLKDVILLPDTHGIQFGVLNLITAFGILNDAKRVAKTKSFILTGANSIVG